jgi:UPF0755 protein
VSRRFLIVPVFLVVALAAVAAVVANRAWHRLNDPFRAYSGTEQFVDFPPGTGAAEFGRRLTDAGVVRDALTFRMALWWTGDARSLKAGEYRFERPLSALEVVDLLVRGEAYLRRITFPEGLTITAMSSVFESSGFGTAASFAEAARNKALIASLDAQASDLEGYLFPDTYAVPRRTSATQLVALMIDRFQESYSESIRNRAKELGLSTRQVLTLASLVEKETARADERSVVAAVYHNRLKRGMPLQADPTVVYALERAGRYDGNIRRQDLQFDSPYNTYRYPGLPPGPIASPGLAALEAAVRPEPVPFLYFVSRNDGSHAFSETLAQHNRNVREFQVLYFRRRQ